MIIRTLLFCFLVLTTVVSCKDDPDLSPEEQRILDLVGTTGITWEATSITLDGAPANGLDDFSITFRDINAEKTYRSINSSPFLNSTGTWDFNNGNPEQLVFDGDESNIYNISDIDASVTPATLTLTVNFTKGGSLAAGIQGADGTYVFNLEAQE